MQGQFGGAGDKKLGKVVGDVWRNYGLRDGIMRGYWVSFNILVSVTADTERLLSLEKFQHMRVSTRVRPITMGSGNNLIWAGYETTKRWFAKQYAPNPVPVWALLASGATGGVCYWLACYPLDVVKSRIQLAERPPTRGGWLHGGYIFRELNTIVKEAGP
jgi:solute carrier family 25 carnitine/acylcarnitine transporter 20/29